MKLHLNLDQFSTKDLSGFTEIPFIIPFLAEDTYKLLQEKQNIWNESLYTKMFFNGKGLFEKSNLETCDYSVLPFKYDATDSRVNHICTAAANYNKSVIGFYNDDNEHPINIPGNLILFRTSISESTKQTNERVMPVFVPDHFNGVYDANDSIGFCGYGYPFRRYALDQITPLYKTDIIYRDGFFGGGLSKVLSRREYYTNLSNNKYTFCMRGAGNFSYRFYEALSFGRIPILIDTDTLLPLQTKIEWSEHIIILDNNINSISQIKDKIENANISMVNNRILWEKYFTPQGFARNLQYFI